LNSPELDKIVKDALENLLQSSLMANLLSSEFKNVFREEIVR
jgi:hypothetical protein